MASTLVYYNQEEIQETTEGMRLGKLTPPTHSQIDITDGSLPNDIYPQTEWIKIGEGVYSNVELTEQQAQYLGLEEGQDWDRDEGLGSVPYTKWLRIK
jgi:hypothetical protein